LAMLSPGDSNENNAQESTPRQRKTGIKQNVPRKSTLPVRKEKKRWKFKEGPTGHGRKRECARPNSFTGREKAKVHC